MHKFPNGDTLAILVDAQLFDQSVHANLACQVCHTNISGFPHPANTAGAAKDYIQQYKNTCKQCHPNEAEAVMDNAHAKLAKNGNPNTPICADCHNPHYGTTSFFLK